MEEIQLVISGLVQGVGFRYACSEIAKDLGVVGWVKNLPSGDVMVTAQAETLILEKFLQWSQRGPSMASVTSVKIVTRKTIGSKGFDGFSITH